MPDPTKTLLRYDDLKARGIVRNREALRVMIHDHGFPPGFMLMANTRVYVEAEVEAWLERRRALSSAPAHERRRQAVQQPLPRKPRIPTPYRPRENELLDPVWDDRES